MSCRIKNLTPPCGYNVEGISGLWILDKDDFTGFEFDENDLYENCLVKRIIKEGKFIPVDAPGTAAKYSYSGNTHTLETFIGAINADLISQLHLAEKRRYIVFFKTNSGQYFTFGYGAGAKALYTSQTGEGFGSTLTLTSVSKFPLFEVTAAAFETAIVPYMFSPDFSNAYCITE